jgi:SAM-dependent methyltransferase
MRGQGSGMGVKACRASSRQFSVIVDRNFATFPSPAGNHGYPRPKPLRAIARPRTVHTGEPYHEFMLLSQRDREVRDRFQRMALDHLPAKADMLDFGAGTGIDAELYAANGHLTFVYEPSQAMRDCLLRHCRDKIACNTVIPVTRPLTRKVRAITANFAVLNHIADHRSLFEEFSRVIDRGGFVLASMLNPYHLGDARYRWWWANMPNLVRKGCYPSPGESRIQRFVPDEVARAAAPHFRLERVVPRGFGLAACLYMFLLFRRV